MTVVVQDLLNNFDSMSYQERLDLLSEILRRIAYLEFLPLADTDLVLNVEDIFLTLEQEERGNYEDA